MKISLSYRSPARQSRPGNLKEREGKDKKVKKPFSQHRKLDLKIVLARYFCIFLNWIGKKLIIYVPGLLSHLLLASTHMTEPEAHVNWSGLQSEITFQQFKFYLFCAAPLLVFESETDTAVLFVRPVQAVADAVASPPARRFDKKM